LTFSFPKHYIKFEFLVEKLESPIWRQGRLGNKQ